MNPHRSRTLSLLARMFAAPPLPDEQQADRIRFMERDVCLTIKVVLLTVLSYFLFFSSWFDGITTIGELGVETVRGAFLVYLVLNLMIAAGLLTMDYLPIGLTEWLVFIMNLVDGIFVALLVMATGGLESTIYWVFLFLIVRNAVSIPMVRRQIAINLFMVLCYVFAGVLNRTMDELDKDMRQFDTAVQRVGGTTGVPGAAAKASEASKSGAAAKSGGGTNTGATARASDTAKAGDAKQRSSARTVDTLDFRDALATALADIFVERSAESLLIRVTLMLLLAFSCYGINVLAGLQIQASAEERAVISRQEQLHSTGRLAAEIAHQIKNPLSIINNAAFTLHRSLKESHAPALQQVEMIREEVERADRIITELMGYAQLAEGRVERLNIREQLDRAVARVFPPALQHQVVVRVDCPAQLPPVLMQAGHLSESVVNLLTNAREALHNRGRIEITARNHGADGVLITIADDGPGIPPYQLEHIFEPYFSTKEKGTGLGLAIVKHNLELYGGSVKAESELGKGTRFHLKFPVKATLNTSA